MVAQKQGKLKLTDKAADYLNSAIYANPYRKKHPITIEQLLEHTGGFTDMGRKEFASNDEVTLAQGLKRFASTRQVKWQPGQLHSYSNTGYGLAGRVLELATNSTINDWITRTVFKPLAMNSATMKHSKIVKMHLVPGYQADGVTQIPYWHMIYPSLGAINLQPRDMAKLLQLYLTLHTGTASDGFDKKQIQRQEPPKTTLAAKQGLNYGYGLGLYQWYSHRQIFYGHGGDADGYLARFGYQKTARLGYFLVINSFNNRAKNSVEGISATCCANSTIRQLSPR
ncbi:MAG: beta-lactamase family protein [Psychrosphaera sp.]|nr:beta-lactamase family protein [Psychrosphaera sp.]